MLALFLQALGGPLPCDGGGWTKAESARCMAVLRAARAQALQSTVGSCLRLIEGKLFERALLLSPARAEGALEHMLRRPPEGQPTLRASASSPKHSPAYLPCRPPFRPSARRSASPSGRSLRSSGRTAAPEGRRQ
jgi:hypothetical protein